MIPIAIGSSETPSVYLYPFSHDNILSEYRIFNSEHSRFRITDGFLKITVRKKEIIITAGGENVTPSLIEDVVKANRLVSEICLVGDTMPYLIALITKNEDAVGNLSADEIHSEIEEHIEKNNQQFARSHQIKKFVVLPRQFTEADGELTPTMKMKRSVIHDHYAQEISDLYNEDTD